MAESGDGTSAAVTIVILGETGHGKSTLVNALRDTSGPKAQAGLDPEGMTAEISPYRGNEAVRPGWQLVDTPGIGSARTPLVEQVADLETLLTGQRLGPVHGVLVTCLTASPRLMLGTRVVQALISLGRITWEQVVLVGTKDDKAEQDDIDFFVGTLVPAFFQRDSTGSDSGTTGKHAIVGKDNHGQLETIIRELPAKSINFQQAEAQEVSTCLATLLGEEHPEQLQRQLEAARCGEHMDAPPPPPLPPPAPPLNLVVIGECGDGKSTLINHLRDPAASEPLATGKAARGVTKEISRTAGLPVAGRPVWIYDTPGIGDMDTPPFELVSLLEAALGGAVTGGVDGVLVTCPVTNKYIRLGGQVVRALIERGFQGESKWKSIILVGTKADRAEDQEVDNFRSRVAPSFFSAADKDSAGQAVVCSCGPTGPLLQELWTALLALPTQRIVYMHPPSAELVPALGGLLGLDGGSAAADLAARTLDHRRMEHRLLDEFRGLQEQHAAIRAREEEELRSCQEQLRLQAEQTKFRELEHQQELQRRQQRQRDAQAMEDLQWRQHNLELQRQMQRKAQQNLDGMVALQRQQQLRNQQERRQAAMALAEQYRRLQSQLELSEAVGQPQRRGSGLRRPFRGFLPSCISDYLPDLQLL